MNVARHEHGYTLIELLVVILLLGFIAAGIGGGMRFGTRVWDASESRIVAGSERAQAQTILRNLLAAALPRMQGGFVTFEGTANEIAFDADAMPAMEIAGAAHVRLSLVYQGGHKDLRLRASPASGGPTREAVLAKDVGPVAFAFMDAGEAVPEWLASWRDRQQLPDAVRLSVEAGATKSAWPYFVAALPIGEDAAKDAGGDGG